jgi:hypothetical protein
MRDPSDISMPPLFITKAIATATQTSAAFEVKNTLIKLLDIEPGVIIIFSKTKNDIITNIGNELFLIALFK